MSFFWICSWNAEIAVQNQIKALTGIAVDLCNGNGNGQSLSVCQTVCLSVCLTEALNECVVQNQITCNCRSLNLPIFTHFPYIHIYCIADTYILYNIPGVFPSNLHFQSLWHWLLLVKLWKFGEEETKRLRDWEIVAIVAFSGRFVSVSVSVSLWCSCSWLTKLTFMSACMILKYFINWINYAFCGQRFTCNQHTTHNIPAL